MTEEIPFCCPACHGAALARDTSAHKLVCHGCGRSYPFVRGVPVLINDDNSVFAIADYLGQNAYEGASYGEATDTASGLRALYRRFARSLAGFGIRRDTLDVERALTGFCEGRAEPPRVLVIGAGTRRYGQRARFHYTDVAFSEGIEAIVDGHDLPYADGTFDFALAIAVLEHVADPQRVVGEIWRVLKPEGRVFAETPFLQPVHMGAHDFTRFTLIGHRRLFRRFAEVDSGLALGPGAAAALSLRMVLGNLHRARAIRAAMTLLALLLSVPLKLLDHLLRRNPGALDGAAALFFYGVREERALTDRELIRLYRGGFSDGGHLD